MAETEHSETCPLAMYGEPAACGCHVSTAPAPPVAGETEPTGEQIEIAACAYADAAEKPSVDMHGIRAALRTVLSAAPSPPTEAAPVCPDCGTPRELVNGRWVYVCPADCLSVSTPETERLRKALDVVDRIITMQAGVSDINIIKDQLTLAAEITRSALHPNHDTTG